MVEGQMFGVAETVLGGGRLEGGGGKCEIAVVFWGERLEERVFGVTFEEGVTGAIAPNVRLGHVVLDGLDEIETEG